MLPVADYTFWDALWTIFIFFLWILWFFLLFKIVFDVFRRHDIGGGKKTVWLLFILFMPFLGAFAYIVANADGIAQRDAERAQAAQTQFNDYVQSVAGGPAQEIDKAKQLLDSGAITQAEFDSIKAKALAS